MSWRPDLPAVPNRNTQPDLYTSGVTSAAAIRAADNYHAAVSTLQGSMDLVTVAVHRVSQLNALLANVGPDPALLALKETTISEVKKLIECYIKKGCGHGKEESFTVNGTRRERAW